jgi:hypothetical protein
MNPRWGSTPRFTDWPTVSRFDFDFDSWGLNLAVVKFTTVQVTRQPLQHNIPIGMICSAKPVLAEDLCIVQKQEFFNIMLYVRNVHLTKGQAY